MKDSGSIIIDEQPGELVITLHPIGQGILPTGAILNFSGEVIIKLEVQYGINRIELRPYQSKNYFIRITNGKNVITQKL